MTVCSITPLICITVPYRLDRQQHRSVRKGEEMTEIEFLENIVSEMDEIQKNQDIALKLSAYVALMFLVRGRLSALEGTKEGE